LSPEAAAAVENIKPEVAAAVVIVEVIPMKHLAVADHLNLL
jgi:hypothetical protein